MTQLASPSAAQPAGFLPVSTATFVANKSVGFSLYMRKSDETAPKLYRDANYPFSAEDIQRLIDRGVSILYISTRDHNRYQKYLRNNLTAIIGDDSIPVQHRFSSLNTVVRDILGEAFSGTNLNRTVESTKQLAKHTVDLITQNEGMASELFQVLHHDYNTFTHSANVSYYCVLLAKRTGIDDADELRQIVAGALLHDLGKLDVPSTILNKRGRLNDKELEIVQRHPAAGFKSLCSRTDMTRGQLMMAYQHHERLDGSGYPVGITGEQIHPWAQICAVVDVYEALTSDRPYRQAMSVADALRIMVRDAGTKLNEGLLQCWKSIIKDS